MRSPIRAPLSLLILAVWMVPGFAALGVGLHLALDHHASDRAAPGEELSDLLRAAAHGHHHEAGVTDHRHQARVERSLRPARGADAPSGVVPCSISVSPACGEPVGGERFDGRGPPAPLFAAHSSLLL